MSTRTAIFKEVKRNEFVGIYVHSDGYLSYTGEVLNRYYKENENILDVINQKKPLSQIGSSAEIVNQYDDEEKYFEKNEERYSMYSKTAFIEGESEYEYFKANSWEQLKNLDYHTYNDKDEVQGYTRQNEFIAWRGSDNNGYIYVQDINNQWYVSYMDYSKPNKIVGVQVTLPLDEALKNKVAD